MNLFDRIKKGDKKNLPDKTKRGDNMSRVYRKQMVEGVTIPAIIHNSNYFLIQMAVYADGIVSCWHKSDLQQFQQDLRRGWVTPTVPTGKLLSVFHLGAFEIRQAKWLYDEAGFYQHVQEVVRSLNPEMANIYQTTQREIDKWNKLHVQFTADPTPCKEKPGFGYDFWDGESGYIFCRRPEGPCLTPLTCYADKTVQVEALGETYYNMEDIERLFVEGTLTTELKGEEWVRIEGLGDLLLAAMEGQADLTSADKLGEIADDINKLTGEEDSLEICRRAYHYYLEEPSDFSREKLRQKYEAVPEHLRMYLGDMDSRDTDYIRILYHPEDKREV